MQGYFSSRHRRILTWLYIICCALASALSIAAFPIFSIMSRRICSRMALNFCCCCWSRRGVILASMALPICLNCSIFSKGLSEVFFFSAPSCFTSSCRKGTICYFCCSFRPSSIENVLSVAVSGLSTNCGLGMIS